MTEPVVPARQRTSWLAGFAFLFGLAAVMVTMAGGILYLLAHWGDLLQLGTEERRILLMAGKIVLVTTVGPAILALAFALGARSVIREAQGELRGKGLYRTGLLMTFLAILIVFGGRRSLSSMTEASLEDLSDGKAKKEIMK